MASNSFEWSNFSSLNKRKLQQQAVKLEVGKMADLPWRSRYESIESFIPSRIFMRSEDKKVEQGFRGRKSSYDSGLGKSEPELSDCWLTSPRPVQVGEGEAETQARHAQLLQQLQDCRDALMPVEGKKDLLQEQNEKLEQENREL